MQIDDFKKQIEAMPRDHNGLVTIRFRQHGYLVEGSVDPDVLCDERGEFTLSNTKLENMDTGGLESLSEPGLYCSLVDSISELQHIEQPVASAPRRPG